MWRMLRFLRLTPLRKETPSITGPFASLPLEITQYIASFLPANAAAAFALCDRYLSQAVGTQYWTSLRSPCEKEERDLFLQLLDRDLPDHLFCQRCARLPLPTRAGMDEWKHAEQINRRRQRRCFQEDLKAKADYYFPFSFRSEHVQMALKLHRLNLDVKKYLRTLACVEKSACEFPNFKIFEARVVSDEMIVRSQHWLLIPAGQVFELSRKLYPCPQVCPHLTTGPYCDDDNILTDLLQCKVEHINKDEDPCTQCTGLKQCQYCPTEMQIDVKVFEDRGTALFITKWLAVGAGISPADPKWRSHLHDEDFRPVFQSVSFKEGSIRNAFEQQADFDFESPLTPEIAHQVLVYRA